MKNTLIGILTFSVLYLPSLAMAQGVQGNADMAAKTKQMSEAMMKVVLAQPQNYKSLKGAFYVTDANDNNYYLAKKIDLFADTKYVEIKKNGQAGFIANWVMHKNTDVGFSMAMSAFMHELLQLPEAKGYTIEDGRMDSLTNSTTHYLKSPGENGKRVAMLIFNIKYREATFIVDGNL